MPLHISPESRFRKLSLRVKRSSLAFFREIATHPSGARNDRSVKGFSFLNRDLGQHGLLKISFPKDMIPEKGGEKWINFSTQIQWS